MIKFGRFSVNIYPDSGIFIDNRGLITFKGKCEIGNNSFISVGETGKLEFGEHFCCTTSLKLACYNRILFGSHVLVGWDCMFIDTDFHSLTRNDGSKNKGFGPIIIGDEVWFANGCKVYKNSCVPSKCVVSSQTILSSKINTPERSVIGCKRNVIVKDIGTYRNFRDDKIIY